MSTATSAKCHGQPWPVVVLNYTLNLSEFISTWSLSEYYTKQEIGFFNMVEKNYHTLKAL